MLRTVGLCVIVISGVGCGFAMSNELGRRKKMMEMILRMIILLRGEIRYGNKSLYDAFTGASGKLEGKYREFFILTAQKERKKQGIPLGQSSENRPESVWIWIVFRRKRETDFIHWEISLVILDWICS